MLMVQAKLAIYYAHIYSHLNYVILVWRSMLLKNKLDKLFKAQKECMRSILNVGKTAHTDPIFKRIKILKLTQMIDLELYKWGFKIYKKKQLPAPTLSLFDSTGTCQSGKKGTNITHIKKFFPNILPHTSLAYNYSFMCKTISKFMSLFSKVKNQPPYQTLQQKQNQCW